MSIQLYNTLTRKKEKFEPINPPQVLFYVCGVTVYDKCHVGHARAYVAFDCIRRYLVNQGYQVKYVQNFTDIDDKIIKRANTANIPIDALTQTNIDSYMVNMAALNIMPADSYPTATQHIPEMIHMISQLIQSQHAYESGKDVLFSIEKVKDYGKLSKRKLDDLQPGSRVEISRNKRHPLDFVLWKSSKEGEPAWDSPWGPGRPGWHIECSAMAVKELGDTLDIHGGGEDLIFPHHENEIAQSECYTKKPFSKYWLHNGFVTINDEKMSKSKQNFFTIDEILESASGEALRFFLMRVHYRHPLNFSFDGLKDAQKALKKLQNTLENHPPDNDPNSPDGQKEITELEQKFYSAMDDDFNTAEALGILFEMNKTINTTGSGSSTLLKSGQLLGLFCNETAQKVISPAAQSLIDKRLAARSNRDFKMADSLRDQLLENFGVIIEDTPDGTRIKHS